MQQQKKSSALIQKGITLQLVAALHSWETLGCIYSALKLICVSALYGCSTEGSKFYAAFC